MAATIVRLGSEQQVNTTSEGGQGDADLTMLEDGGWVVTWRSVNPEGTEVGVHQQRFNKDGSPNGGETQVNSFHRHTLLTTTTAALDDGGWVVAWASNEPFSASMGYGVFLQRYSKDGVAVGGEQTVFSASIQDRELINQNMTVTGIEGGGWVVAWQSKIVEGANFIYQREYDAGGTAKSGPVQVNSSASKEQVRPSIARLEGGGWVITWEHFNRDLGYDVVQQRYKVNGTPDEGETLVNTFTASDQYFSSVAALKDGGWIVTWTSGHQDGSDVDIHQQRYYADGTPRGSEQRVNTYRTSDQSLPKVTALDDGGWIVTWQSFLQDGTSSSIHQQRYDKKGIAIRGEQRVNVVDAGSQERPNITTLENGDWVVTWMGQDDDAPGVFQRHYEKVAAFGAGTEDGFGTAENDVFDVLRDGFGTGDTLEAGGGIDTLRMIESGMLDLTAAARFADVEIVRASSGNDVVVANAIRLGGVFALQGGAGRDELRLAAGTYDFSAKFVAGFEAITLIGAGSITFADKATAMLAHSQTQNGSLILTGDAFTAAERQQLYAQGIRQVTDAGGAHVLQQAQVSLSKQAIAENAGAGTVIGTLSATNPNPGDGLRFELANNAGGRFALSGNQLVVANGALLDYESGASHRIVVRLVDEGGIATDAAFTVTLDDIPVETIKGTARADRLTGGSGKDVLYGKLGKDTLTGGAGEDIFVFDTKANTKTNRDTIIDFSVNDDAIWLDNTVFTKLGKAGSVVVPAALKSGFFATGKAKDKNDHVIYDKAKGVLYYDADGSGKGKAVEFATLSKGLSLKASDFFVI